MKRTVTCIAALASAALFTPTSASAATADGPHNGRIAYSVGAILPGPDLSANSQVYTVNPDGSHIQQLTHLHAPDQAGDPSYSPDGRRLLYVSNVGGTFQVWIMRADGTRQHQLVTDPGHDAFLPRWAPDAAHLLFTRCSTPFGQLECTIATAATDGSGLHDLNPGHDVDFSADYSPDGRTIVVCSERANLISAVWRMNRHGGSLRRLTDPDLEACWPDYSPDGSRILISDNSDRPQNHLDTMRRDGTGVRTLIDGVLGRFSPDGKRLVFDRGLPNGHEGLSTAAADGSNPHMIVTTDNLVIADWGPRS